MKKKILMIVVIAVTLVFTVTGCSEADYFNCERRVTVYNARTDLIILNIEGYMSISNNSHNELVVTCKVGKDEYKKNYVYLNDYTIYSRGHNWNSY